ncbi:MAG TPA: chemotaxis protein CheA, partial [Isosphaeraceae bacterium]|nr:chemotaxis protein CheA [Isosphaeraceae bacterium]
MSSSSDDRFREMFYEEARELLIGLEEGLMDLERRQGDRAHLDKTFRAAHSLKGAAAMVGLKVIAEFTHGIEAVLERIRSGSLAVDTDIITTLLEARDHLAAMVEAEAAQSPIPPSSELSQRLAALLRGIAPPGRPGGGGPAASPPPPTPPPAPAPSTPPPGSAAPGNPSRGRSGVGEDHVETESASLSSGATGSEAKSPATPGKSRSRKAAGSPAADSGAPRPPRRKGKPSSRSPEGSGASPSGVAPIGPDGRPLKEYRVTLAPGPDVLRRGINPLGVFDELRELGQVRLQTDPELVPTLDQIDPERCYLNWTITVATAAEPDRLHEVFLFFTEDSTVTLEQRAGNAWWVVLPGEATTAAAPLGDSEPLAGDRAAEAAPPQVLAAEPAAAVAAAPATPPLAAAPAAAAWSTGAGAPPSPRAIPRPNARIRVDAEQLDDLVGLAGELAVLSDNLMGLREVRGIDAWMHALEALQRVSRQIRDTTLDLRMVPVDELFSRSPRIVRDLADRSGKEIELRIFGQETRLDRTIVERLNDPLVHLIRNAVDHALEPPAERLAKGKPRVGRITLSAGHEGDRVAIRVEDDGRGLDREKIVRKGIALGMIAPGTAPEDPRVVSLIFEPGFSTRDNVSELSGRGVGLDVVRDAVRALRGTVAVESTPGKGTAFIFRLPLTLALIDGLLVEAAGGKYVVPLAQVEECVALNGTRAALAQGRPCVAVRGELVPMVSLRNLFQTNGPLPARQELLLTRHAGQRVGVAVDRLLGRVQA